MAHCFDPASAQSGLDLTDRISISPDLENIEHHFPCGGVGRNGAAPGQRTGRQACIDDAKMAILRDVCPAELEWYLMINSERFETYPKAKFATRDYYEQLCHKRALMDVGETAWSEDHWDEG